MVRLLFSLTCYILFSLVFSAVSFAQESETIVAVHYKGLSKTKKVYLEHFLESETGAVYDTTTIKSDEQALRNMQYFNHVACYVKDTVGGKSIVFEFEEKFTLLPIIGVDFSNSNVRLSLGANDYNFLGRGMLLRAIYHYYDRHSFETTFFNPYILGSRWGGGIEFAKYSTIEPTYFADGKSYYNFDLWKAGLIGQYELQINHAVGGGATYLREHYIKNLNISDANSPGVYEKSFNKVLFQTFYKINRANVIRQRFDGFSNYIFADFVLTQNEKAVFYKVVNSFSYFKSIKKRANIATRLRFGFAENKFSPFPPFTLDNYTNVRGVGNRTNRGTAEFSLNTEYRHSFFDTRWIGLQGVTYLDFSTVRIPESTVFDMFKGGDQQAIYGGLGLRIHLNRFYNAVFRLDYGFDLKDGNPGEFVIGLGQYF